MPTKRITAKPITRLTLQQLVRATPSAIVARAGKQCHVVRKQYAMGSNDGFRRTYVKNPILYNEMRLWSVCTDGKRNSYIRFFGPPALTTEVWCWCSCPYFCVEGSSLISTSQGILPIESTIGNITTFTKDGVRDGTTFSTGEADTLLLSTSDGFELRATPNERFWVLTPTLQRVWRKLEDIQPGDFIALKPGALWPETTAKFVWQYTETKRADYKRKIAGVVRQVRGHRQWCNRYAVPEVMTPELARILGYLVAEGSGDRNTIEFTQNTGPVLDDFVRCWTAIFPQAHLTISPTSSQLGMQVSCRSVYLAAFFKEALGYDPSIGCYGKRVPSSIWRATREHAAEFIRAYFEGDGHNSGKQITCTTVSCELGKDLQRLLLALGVRFSRKVHFPSPPYEQNKQYLLCASGAHAVKFVNEIGFAVNNQALEPGTGSRGRSFPYARAVIRGCIRPNGYYDVDGKRTRLSLWDQSILSAYGYGEHSTTDSLPESSLRRYLFEDYGSNLRLVYPTQYRQLKALLDNDLEWAAVESVGSPEKIPTFDATIPEGHHFVANGFVVHNTYHLEVVLARYNSSVIRNSNGMLPIIRNRRMIPHLCKHLIITAKYALLEHKDLVQQRLQLQMKEKEEAAKRAEAAYRASLEEKGKTIPKGRFTSPMWSGAGLIDLL